MWNLIERITPYILFSGELKKAERFLLISLELRVFLQCFDHMIVLSNYFFTERIVFIDLPF